MDDGVKGARAPKKSPASEESGQKAGELLLAVLQELKASREESAVLRQLLAQVLVALAKPEEIEESFTQEAIKVEVRQEGGSRSLAERQVKRSPGPVAIQFVNATRTISQEIKEA